jgi:hypothetical protein
VAGQLQTLAPAIGRKLGLSMQRDSVSRDGGILSLHIKTLPKGTF